MRIGAWMVAGWQRVLAWPLRIAVAAALPLAAQAGEITVSAAASLTHALRDIAPLYEASRPGRVVRLNFGASGGLVAQIAKGAPVDVLVTADEASMDQAQAQGLVDAARRRNLLSNRLVLVVPAAATRTPADLAELAAPAYIRIAIGVPDSVPAGRYAKEALEAARLWTAVAPKTVGATTVRQALDYVARGEVDAGFVYATDATVMKDKVRVAFTVPTATPILYPVAVLAGAPNADQAAGFVDFLFTAPAQDVLARHGFGKP